MAGFVSGTKYETLRRGGTEILRACVSISDFPDIPEKFKSFYLALGDRAMAGALEKLGSIAEQDFDANKGKNGFFRRYNYLFDCRESERQQNFVLIELNTCIMRAGAELFSQKSFHACDIEEEAFISRSRAQKLFPDVITSRFGLSSFLREKIVKK